MKEIREMASELDLTPEMIKLIVKQAKIDTELEELQVKYEKLKVRSEIEELDFSEELGEIQEKLNQLKNEKKGLGEVNFPLIKLYRKQNEIQERISRLNEKRGQIQPEVFESLKNEYIDEQNQISYQISQILLRFTEIKNQAAKGAQTLKYSIEELTVRKEIEEIEDADFQRRIADLQGELTQSEDLLTGIEYLLHLVNN